MMGSFFLNQLRQADLILLNKIDLMLEEEISECVDQLHEAIPGCRIFPVTYPQVDPDSLWAEDHGKSKTILTSSSLDGTSPEKTLWQG